MDIGLMVRIEKGVSWKQWSRILAVADRAGISSVFRSDHYFDTAAQYDSLDAFLTFAVAAKETRRLRFGALVSPVTFRIPVDVARMAAQVDVLSGGRFVVGVGAGWNQAEHDAYGIPFPPLKERFDRLEDAIRLMRALWSPGRATYQGQFYQVKDVDSLPKPTAGGPRLLIGGKGEKRTLRLVAQYADEWNCSPPGLSTEVLTHKREVLEQHCEAVGRDPATIRHSIIAFGIIGPNQKAVDRVTRRMIDEFPSRRASTLEEYRQRAKTAGGMIVGQTEEAVEQLGRLAEVGVREVQFQYLDFDSDEQSEYLASEIVPKVAGL